MKRPSRPKRPSASAGVPYADHPKTGKTLVARGNFRLAMRKSFKRGGDIFSIETSKTRARDMADELRHDGGNSKVIPDTNNKVFVVMEENDK